MYAPVCMCVYMCVCMYVRVYVCVFMYVCTYVCVCMCTVTKSWPTFCNTMDCSMPGFPVFHCLPEFAQIHVY